MQDQAQRQALSVVKTLDLGASASDAFRHFTANMHVWWPLADHSLAGAEAKTVVFEAWAGGRICEVDAQGRKREWGRVLVCTPPFRLVFSWVLESPADATEVEVVFEPKGEAACRMRLEHRGFEQRREGALWRDRYDAGWEGIVRRFASSFTSM